MLDINLKIVDESEVKLWQWSVFDRPVDHPEGIIARLTGLQKGIIVQTLVVIVDRNLEDLRDHLSSQGYFCIPRQDGDPRYLVEIWM